LVVPRRIRSLELHGFDFSSLPTWIDPLHLPNLSQLCLMVFDVAKQDLETLGGFPELRHLQLLIVNTDGGETITTCAGDAFPRLKFCSITKPLKFVNKAAMPTLEVLDFHFNVRRLLTDANGDFDFDFGLGNLRSLRQVIVQVNCTAAFPEEVGNAKAAMRDATHIHPGRPTLEICLYGQQTETLNADLMLPPQLQKVIPLNSP
jgi:hypothetical protein